MADIILPADLPVDWKWDDIIPPDGSNIGRAIQYGYNYAMEQINAAQRACIELAQENESLKSDLANKVIAEPPQVNTLSVNSPFSGNASIYYKNAFSEVTVIFNATLPNSEGAPSGTIATLPVGFRPHLDTRVEGVFVRTTDQLIVLCALRFDVDGNISIWGISGDVTVNSYNLRFNMIFPAA